MADKNLPVLFARKTLGTIILWGTIGLICLQALFYTTFGAAV